MGALLRERIGFAMFSAGSTLGQNAEAAQPPPQTAPMRLVSLDSLHVIRDVGAVYMGERKADSLRRHLDTTKTCPPPISGGRRTGQAVYG